MCCTLLTVIFASCEDDTFDNPVNPGTVKPYISFHTGSLYEELGTLGLMRANVSQDGDFVITDSVLVYNSDGTLVTKLGVESNAFEKKTLELGRIPAGTYTLILWQSAYNKTSGLKAWIVEDEASLSSVSISIPSACFGYRWSLGYAATTLTIDDKTEAVEMTPKSLGCIMDVTIENLTDDLGYECVSMVGGHAYKGMYLDPSRQEDRWIPYGNYLAVPFRIYPDSDGKGKFFTFLTGDALKLELRGDKEGGHDKLSNCPPKKLTTGGIYTVYFDVARSSWQPPFIGSAEDFTAWKADRDAGILVLDPCLNWGCNVSDVEAYVHQKQWWMDEKGKMESVDQWGTRVFKVANSLTEEYMFETKDGQRLLYVLCWNYDPAVPVEMANDLVRQQGYLFAGKCTNPNTNASYDAYFSADNAIEVLIASFNKGVWSIAYQPTDPEDLQYIVNAVDLGLSVKWATNNLGASKPEEFGDYYAWGEVEPYYTSLDPLTWKEGKESGYTWTSYRWCDGTDQGYTKYLHPNFSRYWKGEGDPDGKMALDEEDDAAHVVLGGSWRMPTYDEWMELRSNCTFEWSSENGVEGMKVTSKINENSIFFPAAGGIDDTTPGYSQGYYNGDMAIYWSSSTDVSDDPNRARSMNMSARMTRPTVSLRYRGFPIRPVTK